MTFLLIPGAGGEAWYWHRLVPELASRGHDAVAVDLPAGSDDVGLDGYADVVVAAGGGLGGGPGGRGARRRPGRRAVDGRVRRPARVRPPSGAPARAAQRDDPDAGRDRARLVD